jgi:hypothetical protein
MDPAVVSQWAIAISIAGAAVMWFFKSPKETANEMSQRVEDLEDRHHALDKDYIGFQQLILGEIRNLADAVNRLASAVGQAGITTGEHRVVRR